MRRRPSKPGIAPLFSESKSRRKLQATASAFTDCCLCKGGHRISIHRLCHPLHARKMLARVAELIGLGPTPPSPPSAWIAAREWDNVRDALTRNAIPPEQPP